MPTRWSNPSPTIPCPNPSGTYSRDATSSGQVRAGLARLPAKRSAQAPLIGRMWELCLHVIAATEAKIAWAEAADAGRPLQLRCGRTQRRHRVRFTCDHTGFFSAIRSGDRQLGSKKAYTCGLLLGFSRTRKMTDLGGKYSPHNPGGPSLFFNRLMTSLRSGCR